tara:strand:- start:401 stop:637 length:237 start_codon:yes stop_codon:yes gene_type:complete
MTSLVFYGFKPKQIVFFFENSATAQYIRTDVRNNAKRYGLNNRHPQQCKTLRFGFLVFYFSDFFIFDFFVFYFFIFYF